MQRILSYSNNKNNYRANFLDIFNTKGFIDEDSRKKYNSFNMSDKCINNLYSIVNHYGSL